MKFIEYEWKLCNVSENYRIPMSYTIQIEINRIRMKYYTTQIKFVQCNSPALQKLVFIKVSDNW